MTAPTPVYGLIEWDGSYTPTVVVGCCADAIHRTTVAIFTAMAAAGKTIGSRQFLRKHPLPGYDAPARTIAAWFDELRDATTVPYVTLLDPSEVVHTGDQLLLIHWYEAKPCVSRPGPHRRGAHQHHDANALSETPPPAIVNGYPVVAAVAEADHATSWIVICRRTEQMPEWAGDTAWYVTWRAWWADGRYHTESGDYGPHHGMTWPQAQQSLLRRLDLAPPSAAPVDPDVYLDSSDDGDALTCPKCHQPITCLEGGDKLGSLLAEVGAHQCTTGVDITRPGVS